MSPLTWRTLAIGGTLGITIAVAAGRAPLQWTFQVACVAALASLLLGLRRFQPVQRDAWYGFIASAAFFFTSYGMRLAWSSMEPTVTGAPTAADVVDALGYLSAIVSMHRLGQVRDKDKDPTTIIDALILTCGVSTILWVTAIVPYIYDTRLVLSGRILGVVLAVLSIWLAFAALRLIIGPSVRSASSGFLTIAALCGTVAEIATTETGALGTPVLAFGALALVFLGVGALHPSMANMTEPATRGIGKMTRRRIAFITLAVLVAPITIMLAINDEETRLLFHGGIVLSWVVVTGLVMARLIGLVRAREHMAEVERALSRAAGLLVTATDRDATYQYALTAMAEIAASASPRQLRTAVALATENGWRVVGAWGQDANVAMHRELDGSLIETMFANAGLPIQLDNTLALDNPAAGPCSTVTAPLFSHGTIRGALLVTTATPLPSAVVEAIGSLGTDVSLAVEAVALAEDLHRQRSERRFQSLVQHSSDLTAVLDQSGHITYLTPSFESLLGYPIEMLTGTDLSEIIHPDDRSVIHELAGLLVSRRRGPKELELRARTLDGQWKALEVTLTDLRRDPAVEGIVMNAHDITDRKALENDLRHNVLHDDLTGIANRVLFRDRVDHALRSLPYGNGSITAVLFVDVDDFKTVNDGLGHDVGDELLKVIASRLESFLRAGDTAARLGGDEFAALLEGMFTVEDVLATAQRLLMMLNQPVEFGQREITVSVSIGVALAENGATSEVLLRNADVAMYHAKQSGKSRVKLFDESMHISAFERLELKADLTHALERNELSLHYQPLVDMRSGELVGFEALMRWTHPTRGMVSPGSFIPLAEETGLIVPIGAWALREAFCQLAEWHRAHGTRVGISVNVSPRQLQEERIIDDVVIALRESGVSPEWITLELTESAGLDEQTRRDRLIALRNLGCQIAADDFGTGFASYAALQQLPFTNVKIDRSLITGLSTGDERAQAQVRSIIQMGHALNLTITAEGIEDSRQSDALIAMGADKGQGYLFGRPVAATEVEATLRAGHLAV